MNTKVSTLTSVRSGNQAIQADAYTTSRTNRTGYLTLFVGWGLVALAMAWGLYESVQFLTGVIPKF